jgi:CRISPR-associated helicase Cas3
MGARSLAAREGVKEVIELLEREVAPSLLSGEPKLLHVELPTGYGKSTASALIAERIASGKGPLAEHASRVVHVVPTRYLVEDLVARSRALVGRDLLVRGQCMFFDPSLKDPYFLSDLVFTTLDSYALNFFKVPVAEVELMSAELTRGHFDLPRYAILTAVNVFDEYHLFVPGDTEVEKADYENRAWTALCAIVSHLVASGVPVVLETATPRLDALPQLLQRAGAKPVRVALKMRKDTLAGDAVAVYDEDFAAKLEGARYETELVNGNLVNVAQGRAPGMAKPLLVACNNVRTAVDVYDKLRGLGLEVHLLHALFTLGDRKRKLAKLRKLIERGREVVVVATQVIEVGVDLDFASIITDAAPLAPLVQRVGRVNRRLETREEKEAAEVLVVHDESQEDPEKSTYAGVYNLGLTRRTLDALSDAVAKWGPLGVGWRMSVIETTVSVKGQNLVTVTGLAGRVYSGKPLGVDERHWRNLLSLLSIQMGGEEALACLAQLGSFVRESALVPVYVPREKVEKGPARLERSRLVACPAYKLGLDPEAKRLDLKAAGKVLEVRDDKLLAIVERLGEEGGYEVVELSAGEVVEGVLSGVTTARGKRAFLRALVARPDAYSSETGLKVW